MDSAKEFSELMENRRNMYAFFARLYRSEVDQPLLDDMGCLAFSLDEEQGVYAEGTRQLMEALASLGFNARTDLAVDYARTFLGAGVANGTAAFPYESVYTSPERLIMQDARDEVRAVYREHGLGVAEGYVEPEDHIAFELEFMGYLAQKAATVCAEQDEEAAAPLVAEQLAFLTGHVLRWLPEFVADIEKYAQTDFYRAIGKMTLGYALLDRALLEGMVEGTGAQGATSADCIAG